MIAVQFPLPADWDTLVGADLPVLARRALLGDRAARYLANLSPWGRMLELTGMDMEEDEIPVQLLAEWARRQRRRRILRGR